MNSSIELRRREIVKEVIRYNEILLRGRGVFDNDYFYIFENDSNLIIEGTRVHGIEVKDADKDEHARMEVIVYDDYGNAFQCSKSMDEDFREIEHIVYLDSILEWLKIDIEKKEQRGLLSNAVGIPTIKVLKNNESEINELWKDCGGAVVTSMVINGSGFHDALYKNEIDWGDTIIKKNDDKWYCAKFDISNGINEWYKETVINEGFWLCDNKNRVKLLTDGFVRRYYNVNNSVQRIYPEVYLRYANEIVDGVFFNYEEGKWYVWYLHNKRVLVKRAVNDFGLRDLFILNFSLGTQYILEKTDLVEGSEYFKTKYSAPYVLSENANIVSEKL